MQFGDIQTRLLERLGENPAVPIFYTARDAAAWLNAAQRLFVLLTLCLETSGTFETTPDVAFYSMLSLFPDWLLPLRARVAGDGRKFRPVRLSDLAALDAAWPLTVDPLWGLGAGMEMKYALCGFDLFAMYPCSSKAQSITLTYARCPDTMQASTDVPEIPVEFHPSLIDGAIPLMRAREGGSDWKKDLPLWDRFLDAAQKLADYVRARNKEQGYDYEPVELQRLDRSKLLMKEATRGKQ